MPVNPYSVPFAPLDFSGLGEIADVYQRSAINRDINDLRRREIDFKERTLSAEEYRKSREYQDQQEERKWAREVERIKAFGDAKRMAMQSPELATSLYKSPFGFSFLKTADLGPGEEGPQLSPQAPTNRPAQPPAPQPQMGQLAENVDAVYEGPQQEPASVVKIDEPFVIDGKPETEPAAAALPPATPRMRLYADLGTGPIGDDGQRLADFNEVPSGPQSPTGLGPQYDAEYTHIVENGILDPRQAFDKVFSDYKADKASAASDARTDALIAGRDQSRQAHEKFLMDFAAKYRLPADQIKELREGQIAAMRAAGGAAPINPAVAPIVGAFSRGELDEEGALAAAADKRLTQKDIQQPLQNVVKNAATAERASEKRAGLEVTDENGKVLGTAHNTTVANQLKKQIDQFAQARVRLREFIDDIERDGSRVLSPREVQDRLSKAESVNAAMRVYNGLGATDASQQLEARITGAIGTPGHGFIMGANLDVIKRILHEAELQHNTRIKTALRAGGGRQLSPVLGGKPQQGASGGGDVAAAKKWLADNPNADPGLRARVQAKISAMEGGGG